MERPITSQTAADIPGQNTLLVTLPLTVLTPNRSAADLVDRVPVLGERQCTISGEREGLSRGWKCQTGCHHELGDAHEGPDDEGSFGAEGCARTWLSVRFAGSKGMMELTLVVDEREWLPNLRVVHRQDVVTELDNKMSAQTGPAPFSLHTHPMVKARTAKTRKPVMAALPMAPTMAHLEEHIRARP